MRATCEEERAVEASAPERRTGAPPAGVGPHALAGVLARLGDAIVVVDAAGRVAWWNAAAARRLGSGVAAAGDATCCDVLACRDNTPGRGPRCLTRLALSTADGLAERPLRLRAAPGGRVSAERLPGADGGLVAFHVRLADAPARPGAAPTEVEAPEKQAPAAGSDPAHAPTEVEAPEAQGPAAASDPAHAPTLVIAALGPIRASVGGRRLDGEWLDQRPGQVLRYLLCARGRPAGPEAIAAAIWPDRAPAAVANVRYCVYKLRDRLDGRARRSPSLILHSASGYRLDPARLRLDVDAFHAVVTAGLAARRRGDRGVAEEQLTQALRLYRGDFLADDPYAEWAFPERDHLRSLAGKALAALGELALEEGRLGSATVHLQRLAQLEPFDSQVHELLIETCLRRGRRTDALRHYTNLRLRLDRAFGEEPEFELAGVVARVSRDRAGRAAGAR